MGKKVNQDLCSAKMPCKNEGKIKTFLGKRKLRESITRRPVLRETVKEVLQIEGN